MAVWADRPYDDGEGPALKPPKSAKIVVDRLPDLDAAVAAYRMIRGYPDWSRGGHRAPRADQGPEAGHRLRREVLRDRRGLPLVPVAETAYRQAGTWSRCPRQATRSRPSSRSATSRAISSSRTRRRWCGPTTSPRRDRSPERRWRATASTSGRTGADGTSVVATPAGLKGAGDASCGDRCFPVVTDPLRRARDLPPGGRRRRRRVRLRPVRVLVPTAPPTGPPSIPTGRSTDERTRSTCGASCATARRARCPGRSPSASTDPSSSSGTRVPRSPRSSRIRTGSAPTPGRSSSTICPRATTSSSPASARDVVGSALLQGRSHPQARLSARGRDRSPSVLRGRPGQGDRDGHVLRGIAGRRGPAPARRDHREDVQDRRDGGRHRPRDHRDAGLQRAWRARCPADSTSPPPGPRRARSRASAGRSSRTPASGRSTRRRRSRAAGSASRGACTRSIANGSSARSRVASRSVVARPGGRAGRRRKGQRHVHRADPVPHPDRLAL